MFSRLIGSPFSSSPRNWRLRALYRKQYLTPTMILLIFVSPCFADVITEDSHILVLRDNFSYQRFVKTTPNPRATKNSKGELVPVPPPPPLFGFDVEVASAASVEESVGDAAELVMDDAAVVDAADVALLMAEEMADVTAELVVSAACRATALATAWAPSRKA
jgi:hypothetical protein